MVTRESSKSTYPTWDQYFMDIAKVVASRATCPRASVGCVLVRDRVILATGYNGSMEGEAHCTDAGCQIENDHCVRTVHAEQNAIARSAKYGHGVDGATAYVTINPCWTCTKLLANSGITRIVIGEIYNAAALAKLMTQTTLGVKLL